MKKKIEEQANEQKSVNLPENRTVIDNSKNGKMSLFSKAIFKETFKSNWKTSSIVGFGNAIIIIIVVIIMSTLNLSVAKESMTDLFNNADTETTIKSSSVGLYTAFENASSSYLELQDSQDQLKTYINQVLDMPSDSSTNSTKTMMQTIESVYDRFYTLHVLSSGDQRHQKAKEETISTVTATINSSESLSDVEKALAINLLDPYLDQYYKSKSDSTLTYTNRMINSLPVAVSTTLKTSYKLEDEEISSIQAVITQALNDEYTNNKDRNENVYDSMFSLMNIIGKDDATIASAIANLEIEYEADKTSYVNNTSLYASKAVKKVVCDAVSQTLEDSTYYNYLPDFTVNYVTNELGWPIAYKLSGEYDDLGNPIYKEIVIKQYKPDDFVKLGDDMGTSATLLQKMRKKALTGEDYTQEEIDQAKKEAKDNNIQIKQYLNDYMDEFISVDTNNTNKYYDGKNVIESAIEQKVVSLVVSEGDKAAIKNYNTKYNANIETLSEVNANNGGMTGKQIEDTLYSYASGGIASYKTLYNKYLSEDYSSSDAMMIAFVKSSNGIINQLPTGINDSLKEMSEMNTYGIIIGIVAFGIACVLMPMVYTIILANSLVVDKVETGSLAFTLSTPTKRSSFVVTEAIYLVCTEVFIGLTLLLGAIVARAIGIQIGGTDLIDALPYTDLLKYTLGSFLIDLTVSGICFFTSCYYNKSNQAISVGGGINIFFFICAILGLFGTQAIPATVRIDAMNYFNYVTILSLFDGVAAMNGDAVYWFKLIGLVAISALTYTLGIIKFNKKDLPL